ncbi:MAG TPA: hypothetical protein VKG01_13290 [Thermoanaerobaculia bacterium]|nr:hypothetical protein [Thermoanaerobaculia bacterium]
MAKGARTWILLVVLVVGATGWLISQEAAKPTPAAQANVAQTAPGPSKYPTPTGPPPKAKNWTLIVGPDPCTVQEGGKDVPVAVITRGTHSIKYQANANQYLGIIVHSPATNRTAPAPFKKMTFAGVDQDGSYMWQLWCEKSMCMTGPAVSGSVGGYWPTDQILDGKKCDAGIIIQP